MLKKLILLIALLSGVSIVSMERIKETLVLQEASQNKEEARVKISLTDAQNSQTTHEVVIPARFATLLGALNKDLVEDPELENSVFPLPNVTLAQWRFIESQLERVYRISQDVSQVAPLQQEIITEFRTLDVKSLVEVICASDYLEIPILIASAYEVLKLFTLDKISWDELELLPRDIRNQIIMNKVVMLLGPVPASELVVCRGHEGTVSSVCVTEDGKIVSGSGGSTVRVWDMKGNPLALFRGHEGTVSSVCVTRNGKIVSGSLDKTVRVWDMEGNQLAVCRRHESMVSSVCVTQDGKIVSGSWDNTVRVWDMQGNQLGVCRGHESMVSSVCVTQDGKIVSGSADGTVRAWDMQGNQLAVCRGHEKWVKAVCVTKDGRIVSGSDDGTVRIWDMQGNQLGVCKGHEGMVFSVCVRKEGKIVSGSADGTVRVWDMEGNQLAICRGNQGDYEQDATKFADLKQRFEENPFDLDKVVVHSVCVTKDGKIVSGSGDRTVRVWDIELFDSIVRMDEDQARALWDLLQRISQKAEIDEQKLWFEIEKILGKDTAAPQANINNNNNE